MPARIRVTSVSWAIVTKQNRSQTHSSNDPAATTKRLDRCGRVGVMST